MHTKHWLQVVAGSLMLSAITGRGQLEWHWHPKRLLAGALIFLSTFITWRRNRNDDMGTGTGS